MNQKSLGFQIFDLFVKLSKYMITIVTSILVLGSLICYCRPVVPGCAGCAMAHPDFDRSVNPISTRGDRLSPPHYYWHTRIYRPSDGPVIISVCCMHCYYMLYV